MAVPHSVAIPVEAIKGRGAATRMAHRFSKDARAGFDDGWGGLDEAAEHAGAAVPTELIWENARSAISRNQSPDIYFEQSINPYRGCEHVMRAKLVRSRRDLEEGRREGEKKGWHGRSSYEF